MPTTNELLRAKFDELRATKAAIEAEIAPHREARDGIMAQIHELEGLAKVHADEIARLRDEHGLFDLDNDIARLARELNPGVMARRAAT